MHQRKHFYTKCLLHFEKLSKIQGGISSNLCPIFFFFYEVNIYFVTRNVDLARLLAHMMSSLDIPNVYFHLYYTKVKTEARYTSDDNRREIILARPDFREIFSRARRDTCVYYCGNYRLRGMF